MSSTSGCDMLVETKLSVGSQHASHLRQGVCYRCDRAQQQAEDDGVEELVLKWQTLSCGAHQRDRSVSETCCLTGSVEQIRLRFDGNHLGHSIGIVPKIESVACAYLENTAREPGEEVLAVLGAAAILHELGTAVVRPSESGMRGSH
jgi:hypothetical protein